MRLLTFDEAAALLTDHGVIIYPTSTLYGIGCNALDIQAVQRVNAIKGGRNKGLICLVSGMDMAEQLAVFTPSQQRLARRFWPGPLTLVLQTRPGMGHVAGPDNTIGLRSDPAAMRLVEAAGVPIVSTSANLPGRPAPASISDLDPVLVAMVDGVLVADKPLLGRPSTIVKCTQDRVVILREGAIPGQAVMDVWRNA